MNIFNIFKKFLPRKNNDDVIIAGNVPKDLKVEEGCTVVIDGNGNLYFPPGTAMGSGAKASQDGIAIGKNARVGEDRK